MSLLIDNVSRIMIFIKIYIDVCNKFFENMLIIQCFWTPTWGPRRHTFHILNNCFQKHPVHKLLKYTRYVPFLVLQVSKSINITFLSPNVQNKIIFYHRSQQNRIDSRGFPIISHLFHMQNTTFGSVKHQNQILETQNWHRPVFDPIDLVLFAQAV